MAYLVLIDDDPPIEVAYRRLTRLGAAAVSVGVRPLVLVEATVTRPGATLQWLDDETGAEGTPLRLNALSEAILWRDTLTTVVDRWTDA